MPQVVAIGVLAIGIGVIALIIREILKGDDGAESLYTNQGRKLVPPRSPARRRKP